MVPIKRYKPWKYDKANIRIEANRGEFNDIYDMESTAFLGLPKSIPHTYVSEFLPYHKEDWLSLKNHIETKHGKSFLSAIANHKTIDHGFKWLSEYEILGIWIENSDRPHYLELQDFWPKNKRSLDDMLGDNIKQALDYDVIKFRQRPLKFIGMHDASMIIDKLKELIAGVAQG